jgi:hypothetical protein
MRYKGYVYLIGSERFGWYKLGKAKTPTLRIRDLGILLPFKLEVFAVWKSTNHTLLEYLFHEKHASNKINGEWFSFTSTELRSIVAGEAPFDAVRVYPGSELKLDGFSNVEQDIVIPIDREHKKLMGVAFGQAMKDWLKSNGLESTKENRKLAEAAVKKMPKSLALRQA